MSPLRNSRRRLTAVPLTMAAFLCSLIFYKYSTRTQYRTKYLHAPSTTTCERDFQVIEKNLAFAYSAYIDDRRSRDSVDIDGHAVVRIFIYLIVQEIKATDAWRCLFWFKDKVDPVSRPIKRITNLDESATHRFMPAMALCALPEFEGQTPHSVSIVPNSKKPPTNYVCIEDLRLRRNRLLEDTDGYSGDGGNNSSSKKTNIPTFTICTQSVIDGGRYDVHDIVNFIEVNRILGADHFVFYADGKTAELLIKQCLESYSERGIVEIRPFSNPSQPLDRLIYHGQIMTSTECTYSVMYRTKFVVNVDLDEFIVPRKNETNNWNQLLINIHKTATNGDRIAAYSFRNQFFPHQKEEDPQFADDTLVKLHRIKTLLQTMREDDVFPPPDDKNRSKLMARPEKVLVWQTPGSHLLTLVDRESVVCSVPPDEALLFSYHRQRTTSRRLIRERRMHRFTPQLIENIHFALGRCLPPN